ncbi:hypothetical protein VNI00_008291 [Paramarasmius palmivorus]|uniref:Uncharacterized protein n=1 Tax=Paramarasmius palmivorus TaxID=297713 RepID=A0AAW0D0N1_9AGAR
MTQNLTVHAEMRPKARQWSSSPAVPRQSKKDHNRHMARLTTPQTRHIPVPPSLLHSPLLTSPHSIFQRPLSLPSTPTEEDETWLRDTVPLAAGENPKSIRGGKENHSFTTQRQRQTSGPGSEAENSEEGLKEDYDAPSTAHARSKSGADPISWHSTEPPASPPLVRIRQHYPASARSHTKRSTRTRTSEDDYFHV